MNPSRAMPTPSYYQNIDTGETRPVLQWAMSYTLYQQADGTLRGYTRAGGSQPPITLRHVDTPPSDTPGPHMAPAEAVQNPQFIEYMQNRLRRRPTFLSETLKLRDNNRLNLMHSAENFVLSDLICNELDEFLTWVSTRTETLGDYALEMLVSPDFYSGYDADPYQQVIGGLGEAGINAEGIGIVLTGPNEQRASTIAFRGTSFEQQTEFFNDAVSAASRYLNPNLSYRNLGTVVGQSPFAQDGRPWKPGDLVNISRSSQDGGGLATAHVVRVYPTQVQVVWPNDADHPVENFPRGWYSLEDKSDLIFIREDPEWLAQWRSKPRNLSSAFGSETTGSNILTTSLYPFGIGSPTDGPSPRSTAGDFAQSPYSDPERFVESQTEGPRPVWTSQVHARLSSDANQPR